MFSAALFCTTGFAMGISSAPLDELERDEDGSLVEGEGMALMTLEEAAEETRDMDDRWLASEARDSS